MTDQSILVAALFVAVVVVPICCLIGFAIVYSSTNWQG